MLHDVIFSKMQNNLNNCYEAHEGVSAARPAFVKVEAM